MPPTIHQPKTAEKRTARASWALLLGCGLLGACEPAAQSTSGGVSAPEASTLAAASAPREPAQPEPARSASPEPAAPPPEPPTRPGMRLVPAGPFTMGADSGGEPDERPAHTVTLAAFWLDVTEVTQSAYDRCVQAGRCRAPKAEFLSSFGGAFRGPERPVVGVSQRDAADYCAFERKRLPTEAEFEKAVRGDDARHYPWGNEPPSAERAVFGVSVTLDVGSLPAGRGPYGHDDLAGNVWEWTADPYDPAAYQRPGADRGIPGSCTEILAFQNELRRTGQRGFTGSNPIPSVCEASIRGGAYNMAAKALRATNRVHHPGNFRLQMTGMRCAADADESAPPAAKPGAAEPAPHAAEPGVHPAPEGPSR